MPPCAITRYNKLWMFARALSAICFALPARYSIVNEQLAQHHHSTFAQLVKLQASSYAAGGRAASCDGPANTHSHDKQTRYRSLLTHSFYTRDFKLSHLA